MRLNGAEARCVEQAFAVGLVGEQYAYIVARLRVVAVGSRGALLVKKSV